MTDRTALVDAADAAAVELAIANSFRFIGSAALFELTHNRDKAARALAAFDQENNEQRQEQTSDERTEVPTRPGTEGIAEGT